MKTTEIVAAALGFATCRHAGQSRVSGEPYIRHVIRVQKRLATAGFGAATQAVGLLHDTLEDTDAQFGELSAFFGPAIAARVSALSKLRRAPGQDRGPELTQARLRFYLISFAAFAADHADVLAVKMADQIDNLTDSAAVPERMERKQAEVRDLFLPIYQSNRDAIDPSLRPGYDALLSAVTGLCQPVADERAAHAG